MEIDDQKQTYEGFIKFSVRGVIATVVVLVFLAAFVA